MKWLKFFWPKRREPEPVKENAPAQVDRAAVEALAGALQDDYRYTRWNAVEALGKIGTPEAVELIRKATRDENSEVRSFAVMTLGKFKEAFQDVMNFLADNDSDVRKQAVRALTWNHSENPQVIDGFLRGMTDFDWQVRMEAKFALSDYLKKNSAAAEFSAVISRVTGLLDHSNPKVREEALALLEEFPGKQLLPAVVELLRHTDWGVRYHSIKLLGKIADPSAQEPLEAMLRSPEFGIRLEAAAALEAIGAQSTPALAEYNRTQREQDQAIVQKNRQNGEKAVALENELLPKCQRTTFGDLAAQDAEEVYADFASLIDLRYPKSEFGYQSFPGLRADPMVLSTIFAALIERGKIESVGREVFRLLGNQDPPAGK